MTANDIALTFLGEEKEFRVPFFQRNYVWKESNWEELLESFDDQSLPFLGSIILKLCTDENGNTYHTIIDGQQRLTTITILTKAIFDSLPDTYRKPGEGSWNVIQSYLFYRKNASAGFSQSHIKIQHSRVDRSDYAKVIKSGLFDDCPLFDWKAITPNDSAILRCYKYYREQLSFRSEDELKDLLDHMYDGQRHYFVKILLKESDSNEQRIFDTINRAGVHLSAADIIKNNLFRMLLDKRGEVGETEKDVCELYDENWANIFSLNSDVQVLWDIKRVFGNVQRTNLEFLLYCYAIIKWGQSKDVFSELERVYNDNLKNLSYGQLKAVVKEIHNYGSLYKEKIIDFQCRLQDTEDTPFFKHKAFVDHLLLILERFGVQMFYPYILKRLMDYRGDYNNPGLKRDFGILESFVVRRRLSGKGVTDYSTKCNQILHGEGESQGNNIIETLVRDLNNPNTGLMDADLINYIRKPNTETAKILLFCIELYLIDKYSVDPNFLTYTFTLEHILPQKWIANWSNVKITDEYGAEADGTEEEKKILREKALRSLGNMLLLSRKLNTSVSNGSFENKNENKLGYKECSKLKTTEEALWLYNHGDKVWDEKHIYDREKVLLDQIITIWPNYSELIDKQDDEQGTIEIGAIDDAISPSVDDFSPEALADPLKLIDEMVSLQNGGENNVLWESSIAFQSDQESTDFWSYVTTMTMSYSYKPVLLKAFLENANESGVALFSKVIDSFLDFYVQRKVRNEIVEQEDSILCKPDCSKDEVKALILRYPYDRFNRRGILILNPADGTIQLSKSIWSKLSGNDFEIIKRICNSKIAQYYDRIG